MDKKELETLFEDNKRLVYKFANKYKNKYLFLYEDFEDMIQDLLVSFWKSLSKYDSTYKLSTYVEVVLLNCCRYKARENARKTNIILVDNEIIENKNDTIKVIEINNNDDEDIFDTIPDKTPNILDVMCVKQLLEIINMNKYMKLKVLGYKRNEIAKITNTNMSKVMYELKKEKERIKRVLIKENII